MMRLMRSWAVVWKRMLHSSVQTAHTPAKPDYAPFDLYLGRWSTVVLTFELLL